MSGAEIINQIRHEASVNTKYHALYSPSDDIFLFLFVWKHNIQLIKLNKLFVKRIIRI